MTDISSLISQIRELLPKVTPGPWRHHAPDRGYCIDYIVTDAPDAKDESRHSDYIAETGNVSGPRGTRYFEHDAAYIALLDPVTATALLDRLEITERELASSQYQREAGVEEINRLTKHIADLEENLTEAEKDTHYWVCEYDKERAKLAEARAEALEEAAAICESASRELVPGELPRGVCVGLAAAIRALKSGGENG